MIHEKKKEKKNQMSIAPSDIIINYAAAYVFLDSIFSFRMLIVADHTREFSRVDLQVPRVSLGD